MKLTARLFGGDQVSGFACPARRDSMGNMKGDGMIYFQPILALTAGILILLIPRLLNYIVAVYLILYGIMGLIRG